MFSRAMLPLLVSMLVVLLLLSSSSCVLCQSSGVSVYLSYTTSVDTESNQAGTPNTQACGYLELSCATVDAATQSFNCSQVVRGTHYLYPKPGPTYLTQVTPFVASALPLPSCGAGTLLPLSNDMAFGLEGGGCVHLYLSNGVVHANPSPVTTRTSNLLLFAYSSDVSAVPACPVYTPAYSTVVTYFTYIAGQPNVIAGTSWCGTGALLCNTSNSDSSVQSCRTLLNGTLYKYSGQFGTTQMLTLTPSRALNWQCHGPESDFIFPFAAGFAFYYTGADGLVGCQSIYAFANTGAIQLQDMPNFEFSQNNEEGISSFTYGSTPALAGSCPAPNIVGPPGQTLQASICFIFYATPGYLEYPWSSAIKLNVYYDSTAIGPNGAAVQLLNATGTRTFTNKYGSSFTTAITGLSTSSNNWLFLNGQPVDDNGITVQLSADIQVPGQAPVRTGNRERLAAGSRGSGVNEILIAIDPLTGAEKLLPVGLIDPVSTAVVSTIPGFIGVTIGTGSLNAVTANYQTCTAAININNGLANRPSSNIGATSLVYRYTFSITDGSFTTTANMLITCSSASPQQDSLGNYYQTVVAMNGTRTYQNGDFSVTSYIVRPFLWPTASSYYSPNRIYPFSYSSSPPRTYAVATTPFLDVSGVQFVVEPPVPNDDSLSYSFTAAALTNDGDLLNSACYYSAPNTLSVWAVGVAIFFSTEVNGFSQPNLSEYPYGPLLARNDASPYNFTGCGLSADGTTIWILDANRNTLYASASASISLTTAATFAQEPLSFSPSLVVDPTNLIAYVAFASGHLYAVPLNPAASTYGQSYNTPTATYSQPITALTLDSTFTTLYFGVSKTTTATAAIRSVAVSAAPCRRCRARLCYTAAAC